MTTKELLAQPINLEKLIDSLDFHEEDVENAIRQQPGLFLEVSRYRVRKMRQRIRCETLFEKEKAELALRLRARRSEGGRAITEGAIRNHQDQSNHCKERKKAYHQAEVEEEFAKLLVEAFRQRRDACKVIVESMGAETARELRGERERIAREGLRSLKDSVRRRHKQLSRTDSVKGERDDV